MRVLGNVLCTVTDDDIINGTVTIPDKINIIGPKAFQDCRFLRYINLPNSVHRISGDAFKGCQQLKEINLPNSVKEIGSFAFMGCQRLKKINLPNSVKEIGSFAFMGCLRLKKINLPNSVSYIGEAAFYDCISLSNIIIPEKVRFINEKTFGGCISLKNIKIMGNLTGIKHEAFANCKNLRSFCITKSLKHLGINAFCGCSKLNLCIETSLVLFDRIRSSCGYFTEPATINGLATIDFKKLQIYHSYTTVEIRYDSFHFDERMLDFIDSARKEELFDIIKSKLHKNGIKGIKYYKYKEHENFIDECLQKFYKLRAGFNYMLEIDNYVSRYIKSCVKVRNNKSSEIEEISSEITLRQIDNIVSECLEDSIDIKKDVSVDDNSINVISSKIVEQGDKTPKANNDYQYIFNLLSKLPNDEIALIRDMVKNDFFDENIEIYINMGREEKIEFLKKQSQELNKQSEASLEEKPVVYKVLLEKEPIEVYKARQKQK